MNTITATKTFICMYCGHCAATKLDDTQHWIDVHKAEHDEFKQRRMERFGY